MTIKMHSWWSCEFGSILKKLTKLCMPFDSVIPLLGLYSKAIKERRKEPICTTIFIAAVLVVVENWKLRGTHELRKGWTNYDIWILCCKKHWKGWLKRHLKRLTWIDSKQSEQNWENNLYTWEDQTALKKLRTHINVMINYNPRVPMMKKITSLLSKRWWTQNTKWDRFLDMANVKICFACLSILVARFPFPCLSKPLKMGGGGRERK